MVQPSRGSKSKVTRISPTKCPLKIGYGLHLQQSQPGSGLSLSSRVAGKTLRYLVPFSDQRPPQVCECLWSASPSNAAPKLVPRVFNRNHVGAQRGPGKNWNVVGLKHRRIMTHLNISQNWHMNNCFQSVSVIPYTHCRTSAC